MSLRMNVALFIAYCVIAVFWIALGWLWLVELNPSLPLIPVASFMLALLSAAYAGNRWASIK